METTLWFLHKVKNEAFKKTKGNFEGICHLSNLSSFNPFMPGGNKKVTHA